MTGAAHLSPAQVAQFHAAKAVAIASALVAGRSSRGKARDAAADLLLALAFDADAREIAKLVALARMAMAITIAAADEDDEIWRDQLFELLERLETILRRRCAALRDAGLLT